MKKFALLLLILAAALLLAAPAQAAYIGKIVDAKTKAPVEGALITLGAEVAHTGTDGTFRLESSGETLKLRAPGYARRELATAELKEPNAEIPLTPFQPRALYLTVYGAWSSKIRAAALETIEKNQMNALVIDIKGDRGYIPFKVDLPLAEEVRTHFGAERTILIKDMKALVTGLKEKGLYLIARIVVFKDDPLAAARPEWAVKVQGGGVFKDRERLRWVDPFNKEVWNYNIAIAKLGAELGFDEIEFDYVRCPDKKGVVFSQPNTMENRTKAISGFLQAAHEALAPYNVMVAADIFGYVFWNLDDTGIGQTVQDAVNAVDVVCPMLYPSGYHLGIPNYRNPVQHPYEIVYLTLQNGQKRTGVTPLRFRPWLQAFRDYAFHGGDFGDERVQTQIKAAEKFGSSGWMFWNPRNIYPKGGFTSSRGEANDAKPAAAPAAASPQ
jgi:hypothetical protein